MMNYTMNNEKKAIDELDFDELDIVSGGVDRSSDSAGSLIEWIIDLFF